MTYLPSLPDDAVLLDVFRAYPATSRPLLEYHQALLRGPSPLTVAERELIAAYVSGLNACGAVLHGPCSRAGEQECRLVLPHPSPLARKIKNHVAFWNGVQVDTGAVG